jgi:hypothetical protein
MSESRLKGHRYSILARSSCNKQEASVPDQVRLGRELGDRSGGIYVNAFTLEGYTASNPRNMQRVVRDIIARKAAGEDFDQLYVHDATRLSRSGGPEAWRLVGELNAAGIEIVYVANPIDNPRHERIVRHLEFEMANEQVFRGSQTIARGLTSALQAGRRLYCSRRPFGTALGILNGSGALRFIIQDRPDGTQVKIDAETGAVVETFGPGQHFRKQKFEQPVLIPGAPEAIEAVALIYRSHLLDDLGTHRIAMDLNARNIRPARGGDWSAAKVQRVLNNPIYSGREVAQRVSQARYHRTGMGPDGMPIVVELGPQDSDPDTGAVLPIIRPAAQWSVVVNQRMQDFLPEDVRAAARRRHDEILQRDREGRKAQPRRDAARDSDFLLSGLLRTAAGDYPMTGTQGGPNGGYRYYRVNRRRVKVDPGIDVSRRIRADLVEDAVLDRVHGAIISDPSLEDAVFELLKEQYTEARKRQDRRAELEAERADVLESLAFARAQSKTSPRAAELLMQQLEPRIAAIEDALATMTAIPEVCDEELRREAAEIVRALASDAGMLRGAEPGRVKQMLQAMVKELRIDPGNCELTMSLALPDEALERLGSLRGSLYQSLKRTQLLESVFARLSGPLPAEACGPCRRRRRAA